MSSDILDVLNIQNGQQQPAKKKQRTEQPKVKRELLNTTKETMTFEVLTN